MLDGAATSLLLTLVLRAASLPVGPFLGFLALAGSAFGGGTSAFLDDVVFFTISLGGCGGTWESSSTSLPNKAYKFWLG